jgi:hypothetical protein
MPRLKENLGFLEKLVMDPAEVKAAVAPDLLANARRRAEQDRAFDAALTIAVRALEAFARRHAGPGILCTRKDFLKLDADAARRFRVLAVDQEIRVGTGAWAAIEAWLAAFEGGPRAAAPIGAEKGKLVH